MTMDTLDAALFIGRHAVQQLLHEALVSQKNCHGVLYLQDHSITAAVNHDFASIEPKKPEHSGDIGGIYHLGTGSHHPDPLLIQQYRRIYGERIHYCVVIAMDTKGRLEADAFRFSDGQWVPIALEMEEDMPDRSIHRPS